MAIKTTQESQQQQNIRIGDWLVSPGTCTVSRICPTDASPKGARTTDQTAKITPRSMDVLLMLINHAGQVVSPSEMLESIWRSPIATDHAVHKAIAELRSALHDKPGQPRYIKTIPKRGYTLIAEVHSQPADVTEHQQETIQHIHASAGRSEENSQATAGRRSKHTLAQSAWGRAAAAIILIVGVLAIPGMMRTTVSTPEADGVVRLTVLPFASRDFSDENQILAEGIRESLIHGLAKLSHLQIVSPTRSPELLNASYLHGTDADYLKTADHILQGSVMSADGRLRVIVQLVRADDGLQEYSDQFDLPMDDIFAVQDEIVENVVSALRIYLNETERNEMRDWGTTNPLAYERFLRGEFFNNQFNPADWQLAIEHHQAAVDLDPDFLNAYHGMATAANNLAVYSGAEKINELLELVLNVHRQVSRIDPNSPILDSIHAIKLRMRGSSYTQQEMQLREQILSGNPPHFAMAHYALLLIGARMYDEAQQFLNLASEAGPYEISPDEVWSYRNNVLTPEESVIARKNQLQQRPYHVAYLGSVAVNLALLGDFRQAQIYLNQQREVDQEGILVHYSESVMSFLSGKIRADDGSYLDAMRDHPDFYYNNGVLAFMAGDIETGIAYWQNLQPVQLRRLFNVTHAAEKLFPDQVVNSPDYQTLLDSLGAGISWQRRLMEGVMAMEQITGVSLSRKSLQAYENEAFMNKNNLWNEQQWADYERYRALRQSQASTLNAVRIH